jgi:hypothetical protein
LIGIENRGHKYGRQDELAQLEAERDRLLSMIAYHNGPFYRTRQPGSPAQAWFVVVAIAIICGIGVSVVAGVFAGQISGSAILFLVVGLPLLAYISTRKITVFGTTLFMGEILALFLGAITPVGGPAGEPEVRQRLADCEARIMKLKEGRP